MKLYDELYFDIKITGIKDHIEDFISYLESGELDDFFTYEDDYVDFGGDDYFDADFDSTVAITFTNEDAPIEIESFDPEEFLDTFCLAGSKLDIRGSFYGADDDEFSFVSEAGDNSYYDRRDMIFNDDARDTFNGDYDD